VRHAAPEATVRPMSSRSWDAGTYDRVSDVQDAWADVVLERLALRGDETVLDAGCGSGRVTALLLDRLPEGHVVAVDSAPSMAEHARDALPPERATVLCQSLTELTLDEPVDAVFSNAVFHWIADHERLFEKLSAALKPGGRLVAQCGGKGNIDAFRRLADEVAAEPPYAEHMSDFEGPWNYASPEDTEERLLAAGFDEIQCWLQPWPVTPRDPLEFARTVCLGHHLEALPEELRAPYAEEVVRRSGAPLALEYVRLNIDARLSLISGKKG
jgi:trans-aconitate 2-methyltransferase